MKILNLYLCNWNSLELILFEELEKRSLSMARASIVKLLSKYNRKDYIALKTSFKPLEHSSVKNKYDTGSSWLHMRFDLSFLYILYRYVFLFSLFFKALEQKTLPKRLVESDNKVSSLYDRKVICLWCSALNNW